MVWTVTAVVTNVMRFNLNEEGRDVKLLKRILVVLVVLILVLVGVGYGLYKSNNQRVSPDYYETYKTQDTVPEGKVGIFVTALIMPPKHDNIFWYNITHKIFKTIIP